MEELKFKLDMIKKPVWKFVNAGQFAKDNLLYLQETGLFYCGKNYYTYRMGLESYFIGITLSGKGVLEYCGEKHEVSPGSVMFIDCSKKQKYYTDPATEKWEISWVHLNGANIASYYEKFCEKTNNCPVARLSDDNSANEIIKNIIKIADNYGKDSDSDIKSANMLNFLLAECITKIKDDDFSKSPEYVGLIARYIRHHYNEKINLDYLASEFNVSKYHLQRTFKSYVGLSPSNYLSSIRINHAKRLLRGTNASINEIAEQIGMEPNYFIQHFKSFENMTPNQYRKNWSGN